MNLSLTAQAGSVVLFIVHAIVQNVPGVVPPPPPPLCVLQIPLLHSVLEVEGVVQVSPFAFVPPPPASPDELAPDELAPDELAPELLLDELELLEDDFPDEEPLLDDELSPELVPPLVVSSPHAAESPARQIRPTENAIRPQVASFIRRNLHFKP